MRFVWVLFLFAIDLQAGSPVPPAEKEIYELSLRAVEEAKAMGKKMREDMISGADSLFYKHEKWDCIPKKMTSCAVPGCFDAEPSTRASFEVKAKKVTYCSPSGCKDGTFEVSVNPLDLILTVYADEHIPQFHLSRKGNEYVEVSAWHLGARTTFGDCKPRK